MPDARRTKPPRKVGLDHLFAATTYSAGGLRRLWREAAFRHEVLATLVMLPVLWFAQASLTESLVFVGLVLLLVLAEALNTALEVVVDHLTNEWAEFARDAKDLGSLAVMCVLMMHGLFVLHLVLTRL